LFGEYPICFCLFLIAKSFVWVELSILTAVIKSKYCLITNVFRKQASKQKKDEQVVVVSYQNTNQRNFETNYMVLSWLTTKLDSLGTKTSGVVNQNGRTIFTYIASSEFRLTFQFQKFNPVWNTRRVNVTFMPDCPSLLQRHDLYPLLQVKLRIITKYVPLK